MKRFDISIFFYLISIFSISSQDKNIISNKMELLEEKIKIMQSKIEIFEKYIKIQDDKFIFSNGKTDKKIVLSFDENNYGIEIMNKSNGLIRIIYSTNTDDPTIVLKKNDNSKRIDIWEESYILTKSEWAINYVNTKFNNLGYLSDKLKKIALFVNYFYDFQKLKYQINIDINTENQPTWNYYIGNGKFSISDREVKVAYSEAANYVKESIITKHLNSYFKEYDLNIYFYYRGTYICKSINGVTMLDGE